MVELNFKKTMLSALASNVQWIGKSSDRVSKIDDSTEALLPSDVGERRIEEEWVVIPIPSTGLRHFTGISSSYSTHYPLILQGVISHDEFVDIIERLNETIRDYWPCDTCYYFGYGCSVCTFGLSILLPHYCASHSEVYATAMLRNITLKSKFYDRRISFHLIKKCCHSFIEVKIPANLIQTEMLKKYQHNSKYEIVTTVAKSFDVESDTGGSSGSNLIGVSDSIDRSIGGTSISLEIGPFVRPPSSLHHQGNGLQILPEQVHKKAL